MNFQNKFRLQFIPLIFGLLSTTVYSENIIGGFVADTSNGEFLTGVNVEVQGKGIGASTNREGFFLIPDVPYDEPTLVISMIGYKTKKFPVKLNQGKDTFLQIYLHPQILESETIFVEAESGSESDDIITSSITVRPSEIKKMPAIVETDLFRVLQLMPGVQASSEINSGLYIRGGSPDQNLILLDGISVYNPNHFFGFFSAFNPDAIKDVTLIKGGFPAEYGGRISSVIDVSNRDGNRKKWETTGGISLISARMTTEAPIQDIGSFMISGRRTYLEPFLQAARNADLGDDIPDYFFYDLNGKFNIDLSLRDKITLSGYFGKDNLDVELEDNGVDNSVLLRFGNTASSLKWTHVFSNNLFMSFLLAHSLYSSTTDADFFGSTINFKNDITDYTLKTDLEYSFNNFHQAKLGVWLSKYNFRYTSSSSLSGFPASDIGSAPVYFASYIQDKWDLSSRWQILSGLRWNYFSDGSYSRFEPRLSARYQLLEKLKLKAALGWFNQFSQLVTNEIFSFSDQWFPADKNLKPTDAWQYILGLEYGLWHNISFETEVYYKSMNHLLEFKPASFRDRAKVKDMSELFYSGKGEAFGLEIFIQKKIGLLTGWLGYTLAWTNRQFPDLNDGKTYPPKYDRRHDISLVGSIQLSDHWRMGAIFVFGTGQAYTYATGRYSVSTPDMESFYVHPGLRNNYRLEPYHRLDISFSHDFQWLSGNWDFLINIYNIYNHQNIWFRQFDASDFEQPVIIEDVRLLPILPTLGLNFKF